jgi:hypothetical protein
MAWRHFSGHNTNFSRRKSRNVVDRPDNARFGILADIAPASVDLWSSSIHGSQVCQEVLTHVSIWFSRYSSLVAKFGENKSDFQQLSGQNAAVKQFSLRVDLANRRIVSVELKIRDGTIGPI